jgi:hypothetical protein
MLFLKNQLGLGSVIFTTWVYGSYIEVDVPILGPDHFVDVHILREEPNHSLSMLYGRKAN